MSGDPSCLVADDHPALLAAVGEFLAGEGFDVVASAADGNAAVEAARERQPDLALVDYRMPGCGGTELLRLLREASPRTRVAVYTADGDAVLVQDAFAAGAAAVVLKEAPLADLVRALGAVSAGQRYVDPALASFALDGDPAAALTERELDVLRLLAEGLSHEAIGRRLGIGGETVRTHARKASARLGARTRTQAVASAIRLGLIE